MVSSSLSRPFHTVDCLENKNSLKPVSKCTSINPPEIRLNIHKPLATTGLMSATTTLSRQRWPWNDALHLTVNNELH